MLQSEFDETYLSFPKVSIVIAIVSFATAHHSSFTLRVYQSKIGKKDALELCQMNEKCNDTKRESYLSGIIIISGTSFTIVVVGVSLAFSLKH